jgi:hypothetical protein
MIMDKSHCSDILVIIVGILSMSIETEERTGGTVNFAMRAGVSDLIVPP